MFQQTQGIQELILCTPVHSSMDSMSSEPRKRIPLVPVRSQKKKVLRHRISAQIPAELAAAAATEATAAAAAAALSITTMAPQINILESIVFVVQEERKQLGVAQQDATLATTATAAAATNAAAAAAAQHE